MVGMKKGRGIVRGRVEEEGKGKEKEMKGVDIEGRKEESKEVL